MKPLVLGLLPAMVWGGQARFARLGEFEGKVEVQLQAAEPWQPALRNLALPESAWLRTGPSSRLEVELDEGSVLRLAADSLAELSDYSRLSTGQRVTLLSLDHGLAYFTGAAEGKDALILAIPGAQLTIRRGARVRLEARDDWSQFAILEGSARFSSPAAELDLKEGQMTRVEPAHPSKFYFYRDVPPLESDRWSAERDRVLASASSASHLPGLHAGLADLDGHGTWIETSDYGTVWKPKIAAGWAPFRNGKWLWYDPLGYTWVSADTWGWLPFHYGRWMLQDPEGWFWVPAGETMFKPGDVYWLRGTNLAGWGPLAPREEWTPDSPPRLFLNVNTTYARLAADAREIDPEGFSARPREPLATAYFTAALPSPAFPASRLAAVRPALRAGSTRVVPFLPGVSFEEPVVEASQPRRPAPAVPAAPFEQPIEAVVAQPSTQQPVVIVAPPPPASPPPEVFYSAPVYTGIVVVNPPEHEHHRKHPPAPAPVLPPKPEVKPQPATPAAVAPPPASGATGIPRLREAPDRRVRESQAPAAESPSEPAQSVPRDAGQPRRPEGGRKGNH